MIMTTWNATKIKMGFISLFIIAPFSGRTPRKKPKAISQSRLGKPSAVEKNHYCVRRTEMIKVYFVYCIINRLPWTLKNYPLALYPN